MTAVLWYVCGLVTTPVVGALVFGYLMVCDGPGVSLGHEHPGKPMAFVYHGVPAYLPKRVNRWWFRHVTVPRCARKARP